MKSFFSSSVPESLLSDEALSEDEAAAPVSVFSAGPSPQAVSEAASSAVHASSRNVFFHDKCLLSRRDDVVSVSSSDLDAARAGKFRVRKDFFRNIHA